MSHGRRAVLKAALGLGLWFSCLDSVPARADDARTARPQEGDRFVFPFGDREGQLVTLEDLPLGGPQQLAYPMDPGAKIVRNGSTLNLVALVRFDPAQLTEETRALSAEGVVAYSAVCTHQGCPVSGEDPLLCLPRDPIRPPGSRPGRRWAGASASPDAAHQVGGRRLDGGRWVHGSRRRRTPIMRERAASPHWSRTNPIEEV